MKLRRYSDLVEYQSSDAGGEDAILKLVTDLEANSVTMPDGTAALSLPEDSVAWWRQYIATLQDEEWISTRETKPRGMTRQVTLRRFEAAAPRAAVAATHESGTAMGLFRAEKHHVVQSNGVRGSELFELGTDEQTAFNLQLFAAKCDENNVTQTDLPKKGQLVVWAWRESEVDAHGQDLAEDVSAESVRFAMGKLSQDPYLATASRDNIGSGEDWRLDVKSFMPKGDNPDNYKLPALFSRSSFAEELEDVAVAEDMAVRTFASRAQHNKAGRAALLLCDGAAEDENPDGAATGRVVAAGISNGTLGSPDVVAQPAKRRKRKRTNPARRAQRTATFGADCLILFPQVTNPDKWAYTAAGGISQRGAAGLKHKIAFACEHYACLDDPSQCHSGVCKAARARVQAWRGT